MKDEWIPIHKQLPPNDQVVKTMISDEKGIRNEQELKRRNNLWWTPDGSMYVYYTPTHWRS